MRGKTTHVTFGTGRYAETEPLFQYDYGQELVIDDVELPEYYEAHFSNDVRKNADIVIGRPTGITIPDKYITCGRNILCWIFLHEDQSDGETEYLIRIPVRTRSKPTDLEPMEHSIVSDLMSAVNSLQTELENTYSRIEDLEGRVATLEDRIPALGGWQN